MPALITSSPIQATYPLGSPPVVPARPRLNTSSPIQATYPLGPPPDIPARPDKTQAFYWSKHNRDIEANWMANAIQVNGKTLECRHFAVAYTLLPTNEFFKMVQDPKTISQYFTQYFKNGAINPVQDAFYRLSMEQSASHRLVDDEHFGTWLCDLVLAMRAQRRSEFKQPLLTHCHMMALKLRLKGPPGERIGVSFYDPIHTTKQRRLVAFRPEALKRQHLSTLIEDPDSELTIGGVQGMWISADSKPLTNADPLHYFSVQPQPGSQMLIRSCAAALAQAVAFSSPDAIRLLGKRLSDLGRTAEDEIVQGLSLLPCFSKLALEPNDKKTLAFIAALKEIGMSDQARHSIIERTCGQPTTGASDYARVLGMVAEVLCSYPGHDDRKA